MSSGHIENNRTGRPQVASMKARFTNSGSRSIRSTRSTSFTAGRRISSCRLSWVMFFQLCVRWVSPTIATTGDPPFRLSTNPVTKLVCPGAERGITNANPAGHARIGIGGKGTGAFIADQAMGHAEPPDRIVKRQKLKSTHPEKSDPRRGLGGLLPAPHRRSSHW